MPRLTKYVLKQAPRISSRKIYQIFMVPKPTPSRLFTSMQPMNMNWQTPDQAMGPMAFEIDKEPKLNLSLETRNHEGIVIVHCQGRIVYRNEAAALSCLVREFLQDKGKVVIDLSGVHSLDSAGIGELVLLQTLAWERNAELKYAEPNPLVRTLLDLTKLDSVLDLHSSIELALDSFREERVWADC